MTHPELLAVLLLTAGLLSWALTGLVRRYALARDLLDHPNDRSAHAIPVPRGGGLAIVTVVSAGLVLCYFLDFVPAGVTAALLGGGLLTATAGWLDDHRHVPAGIRALVHVLAAIWAVVWLRGLPTLSAGAYSLDLGLFGSLLAVLAITWLINLYNFMDGIDGIAGVNALTVAGFGGVLLAWTGDTSLVIVAALLAGASAGFLLWNWSPARIFLGDVGSGALGFYFGAIAVASENSHSVPFVAWMLLLSVFIVDATITLVRRVARGERWYAAHNNHAYQRATRSGYSHPTVSLWVAAINVVLGIGALVAIHWGRWIPAVLSLVLVLGIYVSVERLNPMTPTKTQI